jgi:pimeloyl-ACP methyl ester carboxylesterase
MDGESGRAAAGGERDATATRRTTLTAGDGRGGRHEVDVVYDVAGDPDAPPAVLVHGCGLDAASVSYRYLLPELATDRRVYAPDLPGHGRSEKPSVRYTTDYFEGVLDAFRDSLGLESPALVGVSMGGAVALGHALEREVDRLVLVDSYGLGGDAAWRPAASVGLRVPALHRAWWSNFAASEASVRAHLRTLTGGAPSPELVADVHGVVGDPAVGRTVRSWQRSEFRATGLATDHSARLADLAMPTLLVHGKRDPLLPASWASRAAERLPRGESILYDGVGHWAPREVPERFAADVAAFLN